MSSGALIGLVFGGVLLGLVLLLILRWDSTQAPIVEITDQTQKAVWDERADEARKDFGLAATRAAAGKWAASIGLILGALTTVAVVAGPSALMDIGGPEAVVAASLVLCAGSIAAVALLLAALAEQGTPLHVESLDGATFRTETRVRAVRAATQMRYSRGLVVVALVLLTVATGIAWLAALTGEPATKAQSALVVAASGAQCGKLSSAAGTLVLTVAKEPHPIPGDARVTLVDSCPK